MYRWNFFAFLRAPTRLVWQDLTCNNSYCIPDEPIYMTYEGPRIPAQIKLLQKEREKPEKSSCNLRQMSHQRRKEFLRPNLLDMKCAQTSISKKYALFINQKGVRNGWLFSFLFNHISGNHKNLLSIIISGGQV